VTKDKRDLPVLLTREERQFICFLRYRLKRTSLPVKIEVEKNRQMKWREVNGIKTK